MGFGKAFGNLAKAAGNTVMIPVDAVVDVATLGGDKPDTNTEERVKKIVKDIGKAYNETKE